MEFWAGDAVAGERVVDVDEDTGVVGFVQLHARGAGSELVGAGARDLEVDTLRVILRAIFVVRRMQRDDLVTQDVVARGHVLGDRDGPAVIGGDELIGCPVSGLVRVVEHALGGNLVEFQGGLVGGGAFAVAIGKVVDDGAVVGLGPIGPLEFDGGAGGHGGVELSGGGAFVADDVWVGEVAWIDVTGIFVLRDRPGDQWRMGGRVGIVDGIAGMTGECQNRARVYEGWRGHTRRLQQQCQRPCHGRRRMQWRREQRTGQRA